MKVFYLLFAVCLVSADAQRRSAKSELLSDEPQQKPVRRGRARFTASTESPSEEQTAGRRLPSRRRPDAINEPTVRKSYAVEEILDESPQEPFRKTRVFTENRFEARNAPPTSTLFQPSTTEDLDAIIRSIGSDLTDTTFSSVILSSTANPNLEPSPVGFSSSEVVKNDDITKIQIEATTPTTVKTTKRNNGRSRSNTANQAAQAAPTAASRSRTRTRATRKPEEQTAAPTSARTAQRTIRRRLEPSEARTRAPTVIAAAETVEIPSRSRTGRKIPVAATKVTVELPQSRRPSSRRNTETATIAPAAVSTAGPTRSRTRSRFRDVPPVIDEQKLEVLPLFERESKTVKPLRKYAPRRRTFNSAEEVETSATENDVKIAPKPPRQSLVVETRTESNVRRRTKPTFKSTTTTTPTTYKPSTTKPTTYKPSTTKPTTYKPSTTKPTTYKPSTTKTTTSKPSSTTVKPSTSSRIKESVIAEVSEVTSKRTLTRSKLSRNKVELPKFVSRGSKKSEVNLTKSKTNGNSSEEDIEDSDNYPEHFKALLQAKKQTKESRPSPRAVTHAPTITKTTQKVVTASSSTTTHATSSEAIRQLEDFENELDPRRRPDKITRPTRKSKYVRSSTVASEASTNSPVKTKPFSPKPPRGLYSSRKSKESVAKSKSAAPGQIAVPKKSSRYSSRYRNDASTRSGIRSSTSAPAYLPTIPTITPPTPTSVKSPHAYQDKDLGVEVISFDDPVNTVPSANLVSGEYLASSTENHADTPLVSASQTKTTEKPVSIIERIINSITAISTTEVPDPTRLTTPTTEPQTKSSAILKLATKKTTKLDKAQTTQQIPLVTVTSEKPTTIIERILSSLSAIQADNTTDSKTFKSKQVGTNFNTISSPSTTPLTRVTKSSLSAPISTSVNPLFVLDEISNEQTLQKRTIDKLLALLNTLMSTTPSSHHTPLVVVTPKSAGYLVGSSVATPETATSTTTTTTATTTTTTKTPTTSSQLFTSPSVSLNSRANVETTTIRYTSTPTTTTQITQSTTPTLTSTEAISIPTTTPTTSDISNEIAPLPLSTIDSGALSTESPFSSTLPTTDLVTDTETTFVFPSTLPALANFEVSPGSVSIFSANDLANLITPDDFPSTTVTIQGKTNLPENVVTTQTASTESTTPVPNTESTTVSSTTVESESTSTQPSVTSTMSSNITTASNTSSSSTNAPPTLSGRSGRLLATDPVPVQNSIDNTTVADKDYFIFAVLNNNTILRKRPSRFPNKETPFLIVGVYPNNTLVRKFPNGTLVPMEPVVRVSGFDTRENPPPLPEITSNQVTPDQGSRPDNKNLETVDQNTIPPFEANPLSLSAINKATTTTGAPSTSSTAQPNPLSISSSSTSSISTRSSTLPSSSSSSSSTSTTAAPVTTTSGTTSTAPTATLPTLTEILNGRTVQAFNKIINISDLNKVETLDVDAKTNRVVNYEDLKTKTDVIFRWKPVTSATYTKDKNKVTTTLPVPSLPNTILDDPKPSTTTQATTTTAPTTTIPPTTTSARTTKPRTVSPLTQPVTTTFRTTTGFPTTTFLPTFLTTLFSTIRPRRLSTESPFTIVTPISNRILPSTTPRSVVITTGSGDLVTASTTRTVTTAEPSTTPTTRRRRTTTTPPTTTTATTAASSTTTVLPTTAPARNARRNTHARTTTIPTTTNATKRLRELTDQQKKDLEALAKLEMEQAALLRQLAFLTNFNKGETAKTTTEKSDLANRIIALAVERDKNRQTTTVSAETQTTKEGRQSKKLEYTNEQSFEELIEKLNIVTPSTAKSEYGNSNDAIVAALLKEQGIGPTTPKDVEDIYSKTTTTRRPRPKTTTERPQGPLMQSLNWLLNVLAPPTTKKPKSRPKPKPKRKPKVNDEELLTHQPTHITPVVTQAPRQNIVNSLSQADIQKLIAQLETIQKEPNNSDGLDLGSIKSLESLLSTNEGVQVSSAGTSGTTTRQSSRATTPRSRTKGRVAKSTTPAPLTVTNNIEEGFPSTTAKSRPSLPPVHLRPVPGVEESDTLVRGQLITAAVNVTRAISSFLGTALQGAASSFQTLLGSGSRMVGSFMQVSSNNSNRPG